MTEPVASGQLRASDADRERVVERLRFAQGEGRLDLFEFDQRVAGAYAAVTVDDLRPYTADLPDPGDPAQYPGRQAYLGTGSGGTLAQVPGSPRPDGAASPARRAPSPLGWAGGSWFLASVVNLMIWGLVSLGAGTMVYPWWIWVAGPWGVMLFAGRLVRRTRHPR